jgi:hypothetical protein
LSKNQKKNMQKRNMEEMHLLSLYEDLLKIEAEGEPK